MKGSKLSDDALCSATGGTQIFIQEIVSVRDEPLAILNDLDKNDTVETIKKKIQSKTGIPSDRLYLVYGGKELENGRKISDYNIKDKDTIYIHVPYL